MLVPLLDKSIHRTVSFPLLIHFEQKTSTTGILHYLYPLLISPSRKTNPFFLHNCLDNDLKDEELRTVFQLSIFHHSCKVPSVSRQRQINSNKICLTQTSSTVTCIRPVSAPDSNNDTTGQSQSRPSMTRSTLSTRLLTFERLAVISAVALDPPQKDLKDTLTDQQP